MNIKNVLENLCGHEVEEDFDNEAKIREWKEWYRGSVAKFHSYRQYNGKRSIKRTRSSMQMAKRVCEDWANLLINEKTDISIEGGADGAGDSPTEKLAALLERERFWVRANLGVEQAFALSMGAFVVRVIMDVDDAGRAVGDGKLKISFINATKIFPLEWDDENEITECAFVSRIRKNRYRIAAHHLDEAGNYVITNCEASGPDAQSLTIDDSTRYDFVTGSSIPWFVILHPNIANNLDVNSPYFMSVFANSIDKLKECDLIFDSLQNEFSLGKKRIFVDSRNVAVDAETGEYSPVFDPNDVAFYMLPPSEEGENPLLSDQTQTLRVADHVSGLQNALNRLSHSVGLGKDYYRFDAGTMATATQVVSENSDLFRTIKKHEIVIEDCLIRLTRAIIYASREFCGENIAADDAEITIKFDDSIIEDKTAERGQDRLDVGMGVMSKPEYRAKWYRESIEDATDAVRDIETQAIEAMQNAIIDDGGDDDD